MIILGINEDLYDAGVALCDGNRIVFASNEERYTRRKNEGGFPYRALDAMFAFTGIEPRAIDRVCVAGLMTPPLPVRAFPQIHYWLYNAKRGPGDALLRRAMDAVTFLTPISHSSEGSILRNVTRPLLKTVTRRTLPRALRPAPLQFVEHHHAHAAGAWTLSGFDSALAVTADGMGDGQSLTVSCCTPERGIERRWSASSMDSFGLFFEILTEGFGFMPCRDEGKLTGLAAMGDPARVDEPSPFSFQDGRLQYTGPHGRQGVRWVRERLMARSSREDVAAWSQSLLETYVLQIAAWWLRETGMRRMVVAGGVFANVKLNQRLHELDETDEVFVYPNMGDGGLGLGAICAEGFLEPQRLADVFLGESYGETEIESALRNANFAFERCDDVDQRVGELLAQGRIVARFQGRMEWGPRALGNRSILAETRDHAINDRLNTLLRRSEFMPFAPAVLDTSADDYIVGLQHARHAAEFMTVCFDCTALMKSECPAVVHVDGTARPQLVTPAANPGFHRVIDTYKRLTGVGAVLNTSFNIHEEPIVRTPEEAVRTFLSAKLDYLAIGPFLVRGA